MWLNRSQQKKPCSAASLLLELAFGALLQSTPSHKLRKGEQVAGSQTCPHLVSCGRTSWVGREAWD